MPQAWRDVSAMYLRNRLLEVVSALDRLAECVDARVHFLLRWSMKADDGKCRIDGSLLPMD